MASTSRDVARACGVSVATVSRAFSDKGSVSDATRRRVLAEAERLGYSPDPAARRLITGRSGNIGLIVPDLANPFFADIAKGVQRRTRESRRAVFIADSDEQARLEVESVKQLSRQVDGLVWASPRTPDEDLAGAVGDLPVVLVHRQVPGWWSVSADVAEGMRQAMENLYALGHRIVGYSPGPAASWSGNRRTVGLREAAAELDLELIELGRVNPTVAGGLVAADLVLATKATAAIAYNDAVGLGMLGRLQARGVSVPDEMSVIACDNIAYSELTTPRLTTINVPRFEVGEAAVSLLNELMGHPDAEPVEQLLPAHLVIRGSTAPPVARTR